METKVCKECKEELPIKKFPKYSYGDKKARPVCKSCIALKSKKKKVIQRQQEMELIMSILKEGIEEGKLKLGDE